uniref:Uncharacterized protein n=1 Tax=Arundo donax TaxID=35708 RepID=A0A0A9EKF2_ARUDO
MRSPTARGEDMVELANFERTFANSEHTV